MTEIPSGSEMRELTAAVIVLARNEAPRIDRCLEAILQQSHPPDRVVVVDHGSSDGTAERVRAYRDERIFLVAADEEAGIAAARNTGIAAAGTQAIFFTDADCVPHRHWLAEGLAALGEPSLAGVEGITYYEAPTPVSISDSNTHQFNAGGYMTCNIAYRRAALVAAGGFDPRFRYGHEDRELAFRVRRIGGIGFNPAMVVAHQRKRYTARDFVAHGLPRSGPGAILQSARPPSPLLRPGPLPRPPDHDFFPSAPPGERKLALPSRLRHGGRLLSVYHPGTVVHLESGPAQGHCHHLISGTSCRHNYFV